MNTHLTRRRSRHSTPKSRTTLPRRINRNLRKPIMSTLTSKTVATSQFSTGYERHKIDIRCSAVLGEKVCAVEADAGLRVYEVWSKTGCEGALDEEGVLISEGGGDYLSVCRGVDAGSVDDFTCIKSKMRKNEQLIEEIMHCHAIIAESRAYISRDAIDFERD